MENWYSKLVDKKDVTDAFVDVKLGRCSHSVVRQRFKLPNYSKISNAVYRHHSDADLDPDPNGILMPIRILHVRKSDFLKLFFKQYRTRLVH
jgi:hypothetical protein